MPVLRKRERIRSDYSGTGIITSRPTGATSVAGNAARAAADAGNRYGQLMAQEAQDTGLALAKAAALSTDENGAPNMPMSLKGTVGRIAARAYDNTMKERFAHHLTTAIQAQLADAESANMHDFEGFQNDAQSRLDALEADLPPEMRGVFQSVATSQMAGAGANIGRRNAQVSLTNSRAEVPVIANNAIQEMKGQIIAADDQQASGILNSTLDWIDRLGPEVANEGQKAKMRDDAVREAGATRMMRDLKVDTLTTGELADLREKMATGQDAELSKYFTDPNGTVRYDLMQQASNALSPFYQKAAARTAAITKSAKDTATLSDIRDGVASNSKPNRALLSADLGNALNLTDGQGRRRQLHWSDWLGMDGETRADALAAVKSAGFPDKSLADLLRRLDRLEDPDEITTAFNLLRDLTEGPNQQGQVKDFMEHVPTSVQALYSMASSLHGSGEITGEGVADAIARMDASRDSEWTPLNPGQNDDEHLYRAMRTANVGSEVWFGNDLSSDNARDRMHDAVNKGAFEGAQALPEEKAESYKLFETFLSRGETWDDAMEMTRQSMDGRFSETKFMGVERSAYAPEKHYKAPGPSTLGEFVSRIGQGAKGAGVDFLENTIELPVRLIGGYWGEDVPKWARAKLGADYLKAEPFEVMADQEIRRLIADDPAAQNQFDVDTDPGFFEEMLEGGRDYKLVPELRTGGGKPVYQVHLRGPRGTWMPLGELDLRDQWDQYTNLATAAGAINNAAVSAGASKIGSDPATHDEYMQLLIDGLSSGQPTSTADILRQMGLSQMQGGSK